VLKSRENNVVSIKVITLVFVKFFCNVNMTIFNYYYYSFRKSLGEVRNGKLEII
jgi:hypothetical protein